MDESLRLEVTFIPYAERGQPRPELPKIGDPDAVAFTPRSCQTTVLAVSGKVKQKKWKTRIASS